MNFFEYSQKIKREIEASPEIMKNLERYSLEKNVFLGNSKIGGLDFLGCGLKNTHHRLGRLESGLWVATREIGGIEGKHGLLQKPQVEKYLMEINSAANSGVETPKFCIGVQVLRSQDEDENRYFVLIQDLTCGDNYNFESGSSGEISGKIDNKQIFYDFDEIVLPGEIETYRYLSRENSIVIQS